MADRDLFRLNAGTPQRGDLLPWLASFKPGIPFRSKPKVAGFGQMIAGLSRGAEERAFAMYAGEFTFGQETISAPAFELFSQPMGSSAWRESLRSLSWLADFADSNRKLHVHFALRLLSHWKASKTARNNLDHMGRALLALSTHGAKLASTVDRQTQAEFFDIVAHVVRSVSALRPRGAKETWLQAASLLFAGTAFQGLNHFYKPSSDALNAALDELILADGGPASRRAQDIIDIMMVLLPLQSAMKMSRQKFPAAAADALHRMFPFLAMLTAPENASTSILDDIKTANFIAPLLECDADAKPLRNAPHTGLCRVEAGKTLLFSDTKFGFRFEVIAHGERIFTSFDDDHADTRPSAIQDLPQGTALEILGDASRERIYFLSSDGHDLRVEDRYSKPITVRFELAPHIKIAATREGDIILLTPENAIWHLSLRGGEAIIEDNGAILKICSTAATHMNWAFKKQTKLSKSHQRKKPPELDLLA